MARHRLASRSLWALVICSIAMCVGVRGAKAEATAPFRLQDLVPDRSLAFVALQDVGTWGERAKQSAIGKMLADPEMKAFLDPVVEDAKKFLKDSGGSSSPVPPIVTKVLAQLMGLEGQVAVAFVDMGQRGPVIAAGLDFGSHVQDFVTFLKRLKEEGGGDIPIVASEKGGRPWFTVGDPDHPTVVATVMGTVVLLSTDASWLDGVAASTKKDPMAGSLGALDGFRRTWTTAGGDSLGLFAFANVPSILAKFGEQMPPEARRIADALGLDTVKSAAYGMSFNGDGFLDTIVVEAPGADHGLLPMLKLKPMTGKGLAMAPASTFYYAESTFAYSTLVGQLRSLLSKVDPGVAEEMEKIVAKAKEVSGVDLEKDLLALTADDMSVHVAIPETGGLYPEVVVSIAVKDVAKFEATASKAVDGLLSELGRSERIAGSQRVVEYHGKRLHVVDLSAVRGKKLVPFTPTWTMIGDRFVVTLVPYAMKELILRMEAGGPGLAAQEDFQALSKAAPAGTGGLGYVDMQGVMSLVYDTAVPLLQTAVKPNLLKDVPLRLDWAQLPAARSMRPYFRSVGIYQSCDGQNLRISIHSPIGFVVPLAVIGGATAFFAMTKRSAHKASELSSANEVESLLLVADLQAQTLSDAVEKYWAAKKELPASLELLTQEKDPGTGQAFLDRIPTDPWRSPYEYRIEDAAKGTFEVRSGGPDHVIGTIDDVVRTKGTDK